MTLASMELLFTNRSETEVGEVAFPWRRSPVRGSTSNSLIPVQKLPSERRHEFPAD